MITQERFDKVKKILQRECKNLSGHEFTLVDNFLCEVRRSLVDKPVETTNEQPKKGYQYEAVNTNATDCPIRITNLDTNEQREYGVEGLPWNLISRNQEVIHYVFTNFKSDIKIG